MARGTIPTYAGSQAGQAVTYLAATAANGAQLANHFGGVRFLLQNAGGAPVTVTFVTGGDVGGLAIADQAVTVAAGATVLAGPYAPGAFNQSDGSTLFVDVSGNVNIAALEG